MLKSANLSYADNINKWVSQLSLYDNNTRTPKDIIFRGEFKHLTFKERKQTIQQKSRSEIRAAFAIWF